MKHFTTIVFFLLFGFGCFAETSVNQHQHWRISPAPPSSCFDIEEDVIEGAVHTVLRSYRTGDGCPAERVAIPEELGITVIGDGVFKNMEEIVIPSTVKFTGYAFGARPYRRERLQQWDVLKPEYSIDDLKEEE